LPNYGEAVEYCPRQWLPAYDATGSSRLYDSIRGNTAFGQQASMPDPSSLPDEGYIRLRTLLGVFPVSKSTLYKLIQEKRFPAPVRIAPNVSGWDVCAVRKHRDQLASGAAVRQP